MAKTGAQVGWGILWFLVMLFGAFPLAMIVAWIYIILTMVAECAPSAQKAADALFKVVSWPALCIRNMLDGCRTDVLYIDEAPMFSSGFTVTDDFCKSDLVKQNAAISLATGGLVQMAKTGAQVGWGILWFLVMLFGAFPLAMIVAWIYIILTMVAECAPSAQKAADALFKVVSWPALCIRNMLDGCRTDVLYIDEAPMFSSGFTVTDDFCKSDLGHSLL
ncbi:hypothetical protein T265_11317 [Opisthorchis viverrini]|uniref:Uncharacterized protein n=1 Tax=Opisthorchis viverrini TaxID=6198 RepID=A0A074YZF0_OPIVI|nr:hypothetical protein T265_11317 [Opisthorchis viverrini]KER20053.1 hypothetical protein T265_11317 [Opisthorchis viverrini]